MARTSRTEGGEKKVSQMGMVRIALDDIGADAKPLDIQAHIKSKFGVELPANIISNYKSQIKRHSSGGGVGRRKAGLKVEDFETVRGLVRRLGHRPGRRMVEVAEHDRAHLANRAGGCHDSTTRASGGMADTADLKSPVSKGACGFESRLAH